jgi:hypothetical protein
VKDIRALIGRFEREVNSQPGYRYDNRPGSGYSP